MSRERIKREAKRLQKLLPPFLIENEAPFALSACQELAAKAAGFQDFHSVPGGATSEVKTWPDPKDAEAFLIQLDVAVASAYARGPQQWDDVNWEAWLKLVGVHEEMMAREDVFGYPALVSNLAMRLHMNPMDLDALLMATHLHEFKSFSEAEEFVASAVEHTIKCHEAFDGIDADDEDQLEEILEIVSPAHALQLFTAFLMMSAVEKGQHERAAQTCRMTLASNVDGDPYQVADAGVCCALEVDDLALAGAVQASILGDESISLDELNTWASEEVGGGRDPATSAAGIIAMLRYLESSEPRLPQHLYQQADLVQAQLAASPLERPFSDVVSKPKVGEDGIGPEFVDVDADLVLAAARYVARTPRRAQRLAQVLRSRPKLH